MKDYANQSMVRAINARYAAQRRKAVIAEAIGLTILGVSLAAMFFSHM